MDKGGSLTITSSAAADLAFQASFVGTPGVMHSDFLEDLNGEGSLHIRLRSGEHQGAPVARADGITLYAPWNNFVS